MCTNADRRIDFPDEPHDFEETTIVVRHYVDFGGVEHLDRVMVDGKVVDLEDWTEMLHAAIREVT